MTWGSAEWFLLVPVLLFLGWYLPGLRLRKPLRSGALVLLVLALCDPQISRYSPGLDLWVLTDRSASAADVLAEHQAEIEGLLSHSKSSQDHLYYLDFAEGTVPREGEDRGQFEGDPNGTRLAHAIEVALSRMNPNRASRLLIISDGYSTEPLSGLESRLRTQEIALDYRLLQPARLVDFQVDALRATERVRLGEPFLIDLLVSGTADGPVPYTLYRDGREIGSGRLDVRSGNGLLRFTDRLQQAGAHRYEVRIAPEHDALPGNNSAASWVEVVLGARVILVTRYSDDPLIAALAAEKIDVDVETEPRALTLGRLSGARAVILNNVPAYDLSAEFLTGLDFFVREQGGGLLMAGGKYSFGAGGYFKSAIDGLLPVSMELRTEHRKLAVAMAIVMDRSGSMGMSVPGGMTKIQLADDGAAQAVQLLSPQDAVTVIAVDTEPHVIIPLTQVGNNPGALAGPIRRIASMGGGIYVYTGLKAAWAQLQKSDAGQRHVVLFADASDSKEPAAYRQLIEEMVKNGVTISVIGMGNSTDCDAEFLKDIARRGNGRIFFDANPQELPAIFAQETVAVARSAFLKDPVGVQPAAGWAELAARSLDWLPTIDGYNLSYLKPNATAALYSKDEYSAPLVAFWQRGMGKSAAISFPLAGEYSERVRQWSAFGDFNRTLLRWLCGQEIPPGLGLRLETIGTELKIELLYDSSWESKMAVQPPKLQILTQDNHGNQQQRSPTWQRMSPGKYEARVRLEPGQLLRGAVQAGARILPFGPIATRSNPEWTRDARRLDELKRLAHASGGQQRLDLENIWKAPRARGTTPLRNYLLMLLLLVLLTEFLQSRLKQ